ESAHGLAEVGRRRKDEAPRQLARLRDADAHARVHDDRIAAARDDAKGLAVEPHAVERTRDAERLAKPAGTGAEQALVGEAAPLAHLRDSRGRLQRADQDSRAVTARHADEVEAPVDAVRAIDVGPPR